MFYIHFYICFSFILIKICSSEIITSHGPDNTSYTYDNSSSIGDGATAIVFKGENQDGEMLAIKIATHEDYNQYLKLEIDAYRALIDTGVVPKSYAFFNNTEGFGVLVMELLGTNLKKYLANLPDKLNPRLLTSIQIQMIDIIENIHRNGIVHRDIHSENFVFGYANPEKLYLIDFGNVQKATGEKDYKADLFGVIRCWKSFIGYVYPVIEAAMQPFKVDYMNKMNTIETHIKEWNRNEQPDYNFIRTILRENKPSNFDIFYKRTVYNFGKCLLKMKDYIFKKIKDGLSILMHTQNQNNNLTDFN